MHSEMQQALHEHSRCQKAPPPRLGADEHRLGTPALQLAGGGAAFSRTATAVFSRTATAIASRPIFHSPRLEASYYAPSCSQDAPPPSLVLGDTESSVGPAI